MSEWKDTLMVVLGWLTASWFASRTIFLTSHRNDRHFLPSEPLRPFCSTESLELSLSLRSLATLAMNTMFLMIWLASSSVRYLDCNCVIRSNAKLSNWKWVIKLYVIISSYLSKIYKEPVKNDNSKIHNFCTCMFPTFTIILALLILNSSTSIYKHDEIKFLK